MRIALTIRYDVDAEPSRGETEADEREAEKAVSDACDALANSIRQLCEAQGLTVTIDEGRD